MSEIIENKITAESGLKPGTELKLTRMAIRQRWGDIETTKKKAVQFIDDVLSDVFPADVRDKNAAVKTLAVIEGQNQADEHLADKNSRLDSGKPTEAVQFKAFLGIDPDKV